MLTGSTLIRLEQERIHIKHFLMQISMLHFLRPLAQRIRSALEVFTVRLWSTLSCTIIGNSFSKLMYNVRGQTDDTTAKLRSFCIFCAVQIDFSVNLSTLHKSPKEGSAIGTRICQNPPRTKLNPTLQPHISSCSNYRAREASWNHSWRWRSPSAGGKVYRCKADGHREWIYFKGASYNEGNMLVKMVKYHACSYIKIKAVTIM
jgi:hypothetical protein